MRSAAIFAGIRGGPDPVLAGLLILDSGRFSVILVTGASGKNGT